MPNRCSPPAHRGEEPAPGKWGEADGDRALLPRVIGRKRIAHHRELIGRDRVLATSPSPSVWGRNGTEVPLAKFRSGKHLPNRPRPVNSSSAPTGTGQAALVGAAVGGPVHWQVNSRVAATGPVELTVVDPERRDTKRTPRTAAKDRALNQSQVLWDEKWQRGTFRSHTTAALEQPIVSQNWREEARATVPAGSRRRVRDDATCRTPIRTWRSNSGTHLCRLPKPTRLS